MLFALALLLYATASAVYFAALFRPGDRLAQGITGCRVGGWALLAAALAHGADIGVRCTQGLHPGVSITEALPFTLWILAIGYLVAARKKRMAIAGALVSPLVLTGSAICRLYPAEAGDAGTTPGGHTVGLIGKLHVTFATVGLAMFLFATILSVLYLYAEWRLRTHRMGGRFAKDAPSLATLDSLGHRCVTIGFAIFTLAILTGTIWIVRGPIAISERPEYTLALLAWAMYGLLLLSRLKVGWQGRRAAWLTLIGFTGMMATVVFYFFRHSGA